MHGSEGLPQAARHGVLGGIRRLHCAARGGATGRWTGPSPTVAILSYEALHSYIAEARQRVRCKPRGVTCTPGLTSSVLLPSAVHDDLGTHRATCSRSIEPFLQSTRVCCKSSIRTWPQWNYTSMHFAQCRCKHPCGQRGVKRALTSYQEIASLHSQLTYRLSERGWCSEWRNSEVVFPRRILCGDKVSTQGGTISCTKTRPLLQGFVNSIYLMV